jgi:ATP-binding cassette subfamily B protein
MIPTPASVLPLPGIPEAWQAEVHTLLHPQENVSAGLEVDLDGKLYFAKSLVILTDQRVLFGSGVQKTWQS